MQKNVDIFITIFPLPLLKTFFGGKDNLTKVFFIDGTKSKVERWINL